MRGADRERELVELLWSRGFAAVRVAGSGCSGKPAPDVVAGNGQKLLAIEVKARRSLPLYLSRTEVEQLKEFAESFGAEAYVALKLPRRLWRFFPLFSLKETRRGFVIDEKIYERGLPFPGEERGGESGEEKNV